MSTPEQSSPSSSSETDPDLWTSQKVAQYLHVSLKTVFNLRKNGLPFLKLGGAVRFVPQEVKEYLVTNRSLAAHRWRQVIRKGETP
jgi:excisionase family DNA binding protein